ncbi:hypothetical protein F0U60_37590 [Archangium minus]|uniref:N-acetylmuramoyl-L-alanine amidase n=1 Tax=Archangium minus TaxID=83450 RepID=A0ABY9X1C4_9BACT|nr:hypothetical protein F0U60_37590 [Archangium minus]
MDTPVVIDNPSPNHSARLGTKVDVVLLHHTGPGTDEGVLSWLCSPRSVSSAHYLVGVHGTIWRLVDEGRAAWHAGKGCLPWETEPYNFNLRSVGVEVVNPGDGKKPFTEAQYRALEWLVPSIVSRMRGTACAVFAGWTPGLSLGFPFNAGQRYVFGHRDTAWPRGRKVDPADNFEWVRIRQALAAQSSGAV